MPSFAERALEGMPKRPTVEHVAGAVEADHAAKQLRAAREAKRQERIAKEQRAKASASKRVDAALTIAQIAAASARLHETPAQRAAIEEWHKAKEQGR